MFVLDKKKRGIFQLKERQMAGKMFITSSRRRFSLYDIYHFYTGTALYLFISATYLRAGQPSRPSSDDNNVIVVRVVLGEGVSLHRPGNQEACQLTRGVQLGDRVTSTYMTTVDEDVRNRSLASDLLQCILHGTAVLCESSTTTTTMYVETSEKHIQQ